MRGTPERVVSELSLKDRKMRDAAPTAREENKENKEQREAGIGRPSGSQGLSKKPGLCESLLRSQRL